MQSGDKLCWHGIELLFSVILHHDMTGVPNQGSVRRKRGTGVVLLAGMTGNPGTSTA